MLTFLRIALVAIPLTVLIAILGTSSAHGASAVNLHLAPSPDDPTNSGYVRLGCGWHMDCTYPQPDDPGYGALDFWKNPCCDYDGEPVIWRMKGTWADSTAVVTVGRVKRLSGFQGPGCDFVHADMYKLDGTWLGKAMYFHTRPATLGYERYIYARQSGYQNVNTWGWMSTEDSQCDVTQPCCHVHQDAQLNVNALTNWARGFYPDKTGCYQCGSLRHIWNNHQLWFAYVR